MLFINLKFALTLTLLTWRIWRAPNNARKWQMGLNSAFKGLKHLKRSYIFRSHDHPQGAHIVPR